MATEAPRRYRAACPHCGAPVEFASAASASAVCSYCQSTLLREGDALRRIGQSAELFDDHSPLQLGSSGRWQGSAFTLLGRLQYRYDGGTWNEWHALFDSGKSGWLSEDNGRHVLAFDAPLADGTAPDPATLHPGTPVMLAGLAWQVASVTQASLLAAQGELPQAPRPAEKPFTVVDLRNAADEVGTLDYGAGAAPLWSVGRAVRLADLALAGLREAGEKSLGSRGITCPGCGAAVAVQLASTKALTCGQCNAVITLPEGDQGAITHYQQTRVAKPWLPLGSVGRLALGGPELPWQLVGWVLRQVVDEDDDSLWQEYLLYHPQEGFAFLVDAEDGWSWVLPLTGAPEHKGREARHGGQTYRHQYSYRAQVRQVLGEFYWRLEKGQTALVSDFGHGPLRLSREETASEVTWSAGQALAVEQVARAFGIAPDSLPAAQRDATPVTSGSPAGRVTVVVIVGVVLLVMLLMSRCSEDNCDATRNTFGADSLEYKQCVAQRRSGHRTGGGSFGGFSSGGSHK